MSTGPRGADLDSLRTEDEAAGDDQPTATPADPSRTAFPMVGGDAPSGGPGPGWEAADKFFGKGSGKN
jgi:hypothetical protein